MVMADASVRHRFFVESIGAETVELPPSEAHHALHVLRVRAGEQVEVFDGAGTVARGSFRPAGRKSAAVEVVERRELSPRPAPAIELAFAVPKGKRLDWLIEKATELGAAVLSPVIFERSVAGPAAGGRVPGRWRGICIAAAKQCGASFLPELRPPRPLGEFLTDAGGGVRLLGDAAGVSMVKALAGSPPARVCVLVGPEGGLGEAESAAAAEADFIPVRLGGLTLRIETAAVALLAAVNACCGG